MREADDGEFVCIEDVGSVVSALQLEIVRLKRELASTAPSDEVAKLLRKYRERCQNSPDGYGDTSCGFDRVLDCRADASYAEIKRAKETASRCCECCAEYDRLFQLG